MQAPIFSCSDVGIARGQVLTAFQQMIDQSVVWPPVATPASHEEEEVLVPIRRRDPKPPRDAETP